MEDLSKNLAKYLNLPEDKGNIKKRKLFSPKKSEDKRLKQSTSPNECFVSPPRTKALDLTKPDKVINVKRSPQTNVKILIFCSHKKIQVRKSWLNKRLQRVLRI